MTHIGRLFIISAASGVGKTSLVQNIIQQTDNIVLSISHTTRPKRPKEQDGVDYFFISKENFLQMRNNAEFLETAEIFGNYYGTSKKFVIDKLNQSIDVILVIDYQGVKQIQQFVSYLNFLSVFILPPSLQTLSERLVSRGEDEQIIIQQRMNAAKAEMQNYIHYDYLVINDKFNKAIQDLLTIIYAEHLTVTKQKHVHASLIKNLLT